MAPRLCPRTTICVPICWPFLLPSMRPRANSPGSGRWERPTCELRALGERCPYSGPPARRLDGRCRGRCRTGRYSAFGLRATRRPRSLASATPSGPHARATQWPDCGRHRQNASRIVWQGGFKGSADLSLASASTDLDPAIPGHRSDGPLRRVHPRHRLSFRRGSVITHRHAPPTLTKAVPDSFSTRS